MLFNWYSGGPYANFGGHDASRGLALFRFDLVKEVYDDLSDLDSKQMESVRKWEEQFNGIVGPCLSLNISCTFICVYIITKRV